MPHPALSPRTPLLLRTRSSRCILAASFGALLASITVSPAANNVYKGGATWNLPTAWSLGHVPTTLDDLFFDHSFINPMVSNALDGSYSADNPKNGNGLTAAGGSS